MSSSGAPPAYNETLVPFTAGDGFKCSLLHVTGDAAPAKGPVILVHGAGVRSNIFRAPVETNIVDALVAAGYDVWLEDWRASIDLRPSQWTLDQAALFDHPSAVETVLRETGAPSAQAIIHCQGSTSFMMGLTAGLLPGVRTVVSNAVSLHTDIPRLADAKMRLLLFAAAKEFPYLNPQWGLSAPNLRAKAINAWVRLTHHECNNMVCRLASFTYGLGFPTLWEHANLNAATHDWLKQEFGAVPQSFFRQMSASVGRGALVSVSGDPRLPAWFGDIVPQTDARLVFIAGELNRCFLPESQQRTFELFEAQRPGRQELHRIPKYAHLDIFMGKDAWRDTFPIMLAGLDFDN